MLAVNSRSTTTVTNSSYNESEGIGSPENIYGFESFDENEYQLQKSHDFLRRRRLEEQDDNQVRTDTTYVRAMVRSATNGGKLSVQFDHEIEFPVDFIDKLNANKDDYMVLQVAKEDNIALVSLPDVLPIYPITEENYVLEQNLLTNEPFTIEEQNERAFFERTEVYNIIDWEALSYSPRMLTVRMLFQDYSTISATTEQVNKVFITFNMESFKTSEGLYMPDGSKISRNLPAQIDPDKAELFESIGEFASYSFLALMFVNGCINSLVTDLDYQALFDAIEGPQLFSFLAAMDVKMPANANLILAQIKDAASLEPSDLLSTEGTPSVAENMFGYIPSSGPLNDRLATLGYDSTSPIAEVQTISIELCIAFCGMLLALCFYASTKLRGSALAALWQKNICEFILWGTIINLILVNYLPVLVATFISFVGMQWNDITSAVLLTNLWTMLMLCSCVICPVVLIIVFAIGRKEIGVLKKCEINGKNLHDRDPMILQWKRDWSKGTVGTVSIHGHCFKIQTIEILLDANPIKYRNCFRCNENMTKKPFQKPNARYFYCPVDEYVICDKCTVGLDPDCWLCDEFRIIDYEDSIVISKAQHQLRIYRGLPKNVSVKTQLFCERCSKQIPSQQIKQGFPHCKECNYSICWHCISTPPRYKNAEDLTKSLEQSKQTIRLQRKITRINAPAAATKQFYEGGQYESLKSKGTQIKPNIDEDSSQILEQLESGTQRKNVWKFCGKKLPRWINPRGRNKGLNRMGETKYISRMNDKLPVNQGVAIGIKTKEHPHSGPFDRDYGEFYKKMNLNQKIYTSEQVLFLNFFGMWRKMMLAVSLVFFQNNFRLQASSQLLCSGIMTGYIMSYWPCARYIDNVSKVVNELTYLSLITCQVYLKEMSSNQLMLENQSSSSTGLLMIMLIAGNLVFHMARLIHNSVLAAQTIKMRRRQILTNLFGPPHDFSEFSDEDKLQSGSEIEIAPYKRRWDMADLSMPPIGPEWPYGNFDESANAVFESLKLLKNIDKRPVRPPIIKIPDPKPVEKILDPKPAEKIIDPEPTEKIIPDPPIAPQLPADIDINWPTEPVVIDAKIPTLSRIDNLITNLPEQVRDDKPELRLLDYDAPWPIEVPDASSKNRFFYGVLAQGETIADRLESHFDKQRKKFLPDAKQQQEQPLLEHNVDKLRSDDYAQIAQVRKDALTTAQEAFNKLDINGDGFIDSQEFLKLAGEGIGLPYSASAEKKEAKIYEFFDSFEADCDGKIQMLEWLNFFGQLFDSVIPTSVDKGSFAQSSSYSPQKEATKTTLLQAFSALQNIQSSQPQEYRIDYTQFPQEFQDDERPEVPEMDPPPMTPEPPQVAQNMEKLYKEFTIELRGHILDKTPKLPDKYVLSQIIGKYPQPLKPKAFQKVPVPILMPFRMLPVPHKPVGENPRGRNPAAPTQSPTRKKKEPVPEMQPLTEEELKKLKMPVRMPEKNKIALQQLTLADSKRYERMILGDVDKDTENLLDVLRIEGKILDYSLIGSAMDPQAEVTLNGGLNSMTKFLELQKKQDEQRSLFRMTNQLVNDQMIRNTNRPVIVHGIENLEFSIASSDQTPRSTRSPPRSPPRSPTNRFNPSPAVFAPAASSCHDVVVGESDYERSVTPRVDLDPIQKLNSLRKEVQEQAEQMLFNKHASPGLTLSTQKRPQTNHDANRSPFNVRLQGLSSGKRPSIVSRQGNR